MLIEGFDTEENVMIVAELSANHGHDIQIAKDTIRAAKDSGANAVKIQTYTPDTLTIDCNNEYFKIDSGTIWDGRTLYDLYKEAFLPWEWHKELKEYANDLGLIFFSTPFDKTAVDFLENLEVWQKIKGIKPKTSYDDLLEAILPYTPDSILVEYLKSPDQIEGEEAYRLEYFHILSGNQAVPTATIGLKHRDQVLQDAAVGDGPVDAIFKAIDRVTGIKTKLAEYVVQAVTPGKDAMGEVTVTLNINKKKFLGRGASTDILEASAKAYISAINRYQAFISAGNE